MSEKLTLPEVVTAICSYYKDPAGNHPTDLAGITALPQFKERYAAALKQANGDGQSAATSVLYAMLHPEEEKPGELPVHVICGDDFDMDWPKGGKPTVRTEKADGITPLGGTRVLLPDGSDRFLTDIPTSERVQLLAGQPAKLVGGISIRRDLGKQVRGEKAMSIRIARDSVFRNEPHNAPWPKSRELSFEGAFGKSTRIGKDESGNDKVLPISEWKGAYRLDKRTKTLTLKFGPQDGPNKPHDIQLRVLATVREARFDDGRFNEEKGPIVKLVVEDDFGNKATTKALPGRIAEAWGIPADGDYSRLVGERVLLSGHGSIDAIVDIGSIGNFDSEIATLQQQGLLQKQSNSDRLQLAFTDAIIAQFDAMATKTNSPVVPHVMIGDKRIVSMYQDRNGAWKASGLAADFGRHPWLTCLPSSNGGNRTGSITWLSRVGGKPTYDAKDPVYAALANIPLPE